jgi:hypothetical protein
MNRTTTRRGFLAVAWVAGLAAIGCNADRAPVSQEGDPSNEQDQFVSQLEGVWAGNDNKTPFGPMPFALSFERQSDGSLHAHTANEAGLYVDLRLAKDPAGRWLLTEEAAIPGRGKQRHTLAAATLSKDLLTFRDVDRPGDLQVRIDFAAAAMAFQVMWQGKEHVLFHLPRLEGAAADQVRKALAAAGQ